MRQKSLHLGYTDDGEPFSLTPGVLALHMLALGVSQKGKTTFFEHLIQQIIRNRSGNNGCGMTVIDPHGNLYNKLVKWCATHNLDRRRKIRLLDAADPTWCFAFDPLQFHGDADIMVNADAVAGAIAQVFRGEDTTQTPTLRRLLRDVLYVLIEKKLTLLDGPTLLSGPDPYRIREYLTKDLGDFAYEEEWAEINAQRSREITEQSLSTRNRLNDFVTFPYMRNIIGQRENVINLRQCMDDGEIVLVNLSTRGRLTPETSRILGTLLINNFFQVAFTRDEGSRPHYLFIDECHQYLTEDVARILDQTAKFGLHLMLATQRLGQLRDASENIYNAVMNGAQTKVVFGGLEPTDAKIMAEQVYFGELDLETPKHRYDKPVVYDDEIETLHSGGRARGRTETAGVVEPGGTVSSGTTNIYDADGELVGSQDMSGSSEPTGPTLIHSISYTDQVHRDWSESRKSKRKIMPTIPFSLDELIYLRAASLHMMPPGRMVVRAPGRHSEVLTVPLPRQGYLQAPKVEAWRQNLLATSYFVRPIALVSREIELRREALRLAARSPKIIEPEPSREDFWSNP